MTLTEIKAAVDKGSTVSWKSNAYIVKKDVNGNYLISCRINGHCIGLTWRDGITLNGLEVDFFIGNN